MGSKSTIVASTFKNNAGKLVKRRKCSIEGCNRFRAFTSRTYKDENRRTYERSTCGKHRKNGTIHPGRIDGSGRGGVWKSRGISMTIEKYNELFQKQNGCCALCGKHQSEFNRRLSVDHNHTTGQIRGLLCWKCNTSIGWVETTIGFGQIIDYLNKMKEK